MTEINSPVLSIALPDQSVDIGEIKTAFGIKGWVKVYSYTRPIQQIFDYKVWFLSDKTGSLKVEIEDSQVRKNSGLIAKIKGIENRNQADSLNGKLISVSEKELATLEQGEYYWSQLIGLEVFNKTEDYLGQVVQLIETGANDVLVVNDESTQRLIPYASSIVISVNVDIQRMVVDWETDY